MLSSFHFLTSHQSILQQNEKPKRNDQTEHQQNKKIESYPVSTLSLAVRGLSLLTPERSWKLGCACGFGMEQGTWDVNEMNQDEAWTNRETCTKANRFEFRRAENQGLGDRFGRAW